MHSVIDGQAPSMMGTHMSHMEPIPPSFHVARTDVYNGNYPHLQVGFIDIKYFFRGSRDLMPDNITKLEIGK